MVKVSSDKGIISRDDIKRTVVASLYADTREEVTANMTVIGMLVGYTLDTESFVMTAKGECATLKSDGTWEWMNDVDLSSMLPELVDKAVDDYCEEHFSEWEGGLDDTFTQPNMAAKSSAVGAALGQLNNALTSIADIIWSKNLVNPSDCVQGFILNNGNINATAPYDQYFTTPLIELDASSVYTISRWVNGALNKNRIAYLLYDSNGDPVSATYQNTDAINHLELNSSTYKYIRCSTNSLNGCIMQLEKGTDYTTFASYGYTTKIKCELGTVPALQVKSIADEAIEEYFTPSYKMSVTKNVGNISVESEMDGKTLVRNYYMSYGMNNLFNFKNTTFDGTLIKESYDDIAPIRIKYHNTDEDVDKQTTIGSNHGWAFALSCAKGSFDSNDVGSVWSDGVTDYTLVMIANNKAFFCPPITKTDGIIYAKSIDAVADLEHVSGATHTTTISMGSLSSDQIPVVNHHSLRLEIDGKTITENGTYGCDVVRFVEQYGIMDLYELYTYTRSHVGNVDYDNVGTVGIMNLVFEIKEQSEVVFTNFKATEYVNLKECGFTQAGALKEQAQGKIYRYVNNVASGVFASSALVDMSTYNSANNIYANNAISGFTPNHSADLYVYNDEIKYGFALGYIQDLGDATNDKRLAQNWLWEMARTKKNYPVCISDKELQNGEQINVVAYRVYFGTMGDLVDDYDVKIGNTVYKIIDAQSSVSGSVSVGELGEKVNMVDNNGFALSDFVNANGVDYYSSGYASCTIKI